MSKRNEIITSIDAVTDAGTSLYKKGREFLDCLEVLMVAAAALKKIFEEGGSASE